jgi:hypothetical protein
VFAALDAAEVVFCARSFIFCTNDNARLCVRRRREYARALMLLPHKLSLANNEDTELRYTRSRVTPDTRALKGRINAYQHFYPARRARQDDGCVDRYVCSYLNLNLKTLGYTKRAIVP